MRRHGAAGPKEGHQHDRAAQVARIPEILRHKAAAHGAARTRCGELKDWRSPCLEGDRQRWDFWRARSARFHRWLSLRETSVRGLIRRGCSRLTHPPQDALEERQQDEQRQEKQSFG